MQDSALQEKRTELDTMTSRRDRLESNLTTVKEAIESLTTEVEMRTMFNYTSTWFSFQLQLK